MTPGAALWTPAYRPPEDLPQTALKSLFTITGVVRVWFLCARVTTVLGASASQLKYVFNPVSAAANTDLCTAAAMSGLAAGLWIFEAGAWLPTVAIQASDGAGSPQNLVGGGTVATNTPCVMPAGEICLNTTGNQTGQLEYYCGWQPATVGAKLVVTP